MTAYGKQCLDIVGNRFTIHQHEGLKTRWRCIKKTTGCPAFVTTINNIIIRIRHDHNHSWRCACVLSICHVLGAVETIHCNWQLWRDWCLYIEIILMDRQSMVQCRVVPYCHMVCFTGDCQGTAKWLIRCITTQLMAEIDNCFNCFHKRSTYWSSRGHFIFLCDRTQTEKLFWYFACFQTDSAQLIL